MSEASSGKPAKIKKETISEKQKRDFQEYLSFFEEVYAMMEKNYYGPVSRATYDKFLTMFEKKIYSQLKGEGKTNNYIKWRSAAYLVEYLRAPDDRFSAFYPPEPAQAYEQQALGKKIDIGIQGELTSEGYLVTKLEPRADAYVQGLRIKNIIRKIDDVDVLTLTAKDIEERLNPLEGSKVQISYFDPADKIEKVITVESKEYFRQTVFLVPVEVPGVFCLQVQKFNRKTFEDMFNYLNLIKTKAGEQTRLILDLRGNPGGPPLAAREISSFFLTPTREFAYFEIKNKPKALLTVPTIASEHRYNGPVAILVNEKSGSASELFSGVMQKNNRATLLGTPTAGQVFLKSMFYFADDSMVLLVTGRGHYPDGSVFSFNGVQPNYVFDPQEPNLVNYAAKYLLKYK